METKQTARGITTVRGVPRDLAYAYALYERLMKQMTEEVYHWSEAGQLKVVRDGLESGQVSILHASGRRVGWLQVAKAHGVIELVQMYVAPAEQGQGLGTAVVRGLLTEDKKHLAPPDPV